MKKITLIVLVALLTAACAKKEKTGLREVLVARFSDDQDLKDYKLDPGEVADCVIDEISSSLPGFAGDPRRAEFFSAYERFLNVKSSQDAEAAIRQRDEQQLARAVGTDRADVAEDAHHEELRRTGITLVRLVLVGAALIPYVDRGDIAAVRPSERKTQVMLFTFFCVLGLTVTFIGIFFRGPGYALVIPYLQVPGLHFSL